ncbi:MAG: SEC-C metal-binding domain-containing protein [Gemmobacter sp.]
MTPTEELLYSLCQTTFLRLWSYANPFKDDGKEFCDLIAVFENHVFIFFDRESRRLDSATDDFSVAWQRWKKEAVDKQVKTALGAERYLRSGRAIFLDQRCEKPLPAPIPENPIIHKVIVAHGAKEACRAFSEANVYGSLGVSYSPEDDGSPFPFLVSLRSSEKVHLLDAHNLAIILGELDTFFDLSRYFLEKERAIDRYFLSYCGEEDLLAHYLLNYNQQQNSYLIGTSEDNVHGLHIGEGEWYDFSRGEPYNRRKAANRDSYLWDDLIQRTCDNFLAGTSGGNADIFAGRSAIKEMAREPRFSRRALCDNILERIEQFPSTLQEGAVARHMSVMPSFYPDTKYVFLQLQPDYTVDYETEYREVRRHMLIVACGVAKNKFPHLRKVVGIAIDAPKHAKSNSEDFILLECDEWPDEQRLFYEEENRLLGFFESSNLQHQVRQILDFPILENKKEKLKVGRNDPCVCGSGKKFKKCCLRNQKFP